MELRNTAIVLEVEHVGKLPEAAMGHNWALSKAADAHSVATVGIFARLDNAYDSSLMKGASALTK